jgi:hypothetical protein
MMALAPAGFAGLVDVSSVVRFVADKLIDILKSYAGDERRHQALSPGPPPAEDAASGHDGDFLTDEVAPHGWVYFGSFIGGLLGMWVWTQIRFLLIWGPWMIGWGWCAGRFFVQAVWFLWARLWGLLLCMACWASPAATAPCVDADEPEDEPVPPPPVPVASTAHLQGPPLAIPAVATPGPAVVERLPYLGGLVVVSFAADYELTPAQEAARRSGRVE